MASPIAATAYGDFGARLAIDVASILIVTLVIYLRRHRRRDLFLAYTFFNIGLFVVLAVITANTISVGMGFGLFALLSIVRLRSEEFTSLELGYLFVALVLGLVNGIGQIDRAFGVILNLVVLGTVFLVDHPRLNAPLHSRTVELDSVYTDPATLKAELEERFGVEILDLSIRDVNYVTDITTVRIRYADRQAPKMLDAGSTVTQLSGFTPQIGAGAAVVDGNGQPSEPLELVKAAVASSETARAEVEAPTSLELPADGFGVDAQSSPVFVGELPGVATVLDGPAMRERLQKALFNGGAVVVSCKLEKALYLPEEGCIVRYELELEGAGGSSDRYLVGGRLFRNPAQSADFLEDRLLPLARLAAGRPELAPFERLVAALDPLPMVVHAFPIDPELPPLVGATDQGRIGSLFRLQVEPSGYSIPVDSCRIELVHYPPRSRCVLRYELEGTLRSGELARHVVYGRVAAEPPGSSAAADALREWGRRVFPDRLLVPQLLAFRPELGLALFEGIAGVPRVPELVASRAGSGPVPETALTLEDAVDVCADIAALLHGTRIEAGGSRSLSDELAALHPAIWSLRRISPELGARLAEWLTRVGAHAAASEPLPPVLCHGEYTPTQVVFNGTASGLLDLDMLCRAEPALDLGQFSAYLRLGCRRAERESPSLSGLGSELSQRFLRSYIDTAGTPPADEERLLERVRVYETVSLVRSAVDSWQWLQPIRTADALSILDEQSSPRAAAVRNL